MVGRGWWLLVLIVCVAWMVCCVCGGLSCQKGQEFYNSQDGQCVPCTRCQDPLVVVVPCYVYRDAVCAPAINFFPNLSQHNGPQAPITLSTPTSVQNASSDVRGHERQTSSFRKNKPYVSSEFEKRLDYDWDKDSLLFSRTFRNSSSGNLPNSESNHRKHRKSHSKHRHQHKSGIHTGHKKHVKSLPVTELDSEMKSDGVSHTSGANKSVLGLSDFDDRNSRLPNVNISDGANSDKDKNSDLKEAGISHWQNIFFLMTVIVLSVCVVVLICIILSQLRNSFIRRKLKRVSDEAPVENNSEAAVMAQLLPADHGTTRLSSGTFSINRNTISENRCSNHLPVTATSIPATSIPSSPSTAQRQTDIESEQSTVQMYPPIPFTMDRLLASAHYFIGKFTLYQYTKLKQALASSSTAARPGCSKTSRANTADRIAEMTRSRNFSGTSSTEGECEDDSTNSSNNVSGKGERRRRHSSDNEDPLEKRRKFLERNRAAAIRCREKKKKWIENLSLKYDELGAHNLKLQTEVSSLRSEVAVLKSMLLQHKDCPVTLAMQGEGSVDNMSNCDNLAPLPSVFAPLSEVRISSQTTHKPRTRSLSLPSIPSSTVTSVEPLPVNLSSSTYTCPASSSVTTSVSSSTKLGKVTVVGGGEWWVALQM
ncbi:uncharacterized protein LOC135216499 [Macrobrachium nipponense]|uniref:uncharacterized protein LOC135216499 n=1 Tax=Macrobrachium nipponense TaxID=159736 RepID=UPI0030C8CB6C